MNRVRRLDLGRGATERRQRRQAETGQVKRVFADAAWEACLYRQKQDKRMVERIDKLIRETQREPFAGVEKPKSLKHALSGFWSRRTTNEHRMVYRGKRCADDHPVAVPLLMRSVKVKEKLFHTRIGSL